MPSPIRHRPRVPTRTHLGDRYSEGARQLKETIRTRFGSVSRAARELRLTTSQLSLWSFGDRRPDLAQAVRLRDLVGISVDAWLAPPAEKAA